MKDYIQISDSLTSATDEMKYYLNCTKDKEDNKEVTPAYLEKLEELYYSCKDFMNAYEYYTQAKLYECANAEEMVARTKELMESLKKS